jgi:hypothetical protein
MASSFPLAPSHGKAIYQKTYIRSSALHSQTKKNALKPWQKSMWCIPPKHNAEFVFHMENVLEVYQRPYDPRFPLICMDEDRKSTRLNSSHLRRSRMPSSA